jgi:phosphohistidine phosphatase SixA
MQVTKDCPGGVGYVPNAKAVAVNLVLSSTVTKAHVTITKVGPWVNSAKTTVIDSDTSTPGGKATVTLPSVQDGEAYIVTITPVA